VTDEKLVRQALADAVAAAIPGITCHIWEVAVTSPDQVPGLALTAGGVYRYAYVHGPAGTVSRLSANRGGVNQRAFRYEICFLRSLSHDGAGYDQVRADAGAFLDYLDSREITEVFDPAVVGGGVRLEREIELEHDRILVEHIGLLERMTVRLALAWNVRRAS